MVQTFCGTCNGELKEGITDFIVKVDGNIIIIKKVPALICEDCGEKYYTPTVSKRIDEVMKEYYKSRTDIKNVLAELVSSCTNLFANRHIKSPFSTIPALEIDLPA